jgi:hypothetical protein
MPKKWNDVRESHILSFSFLLSKTFYPVTVYPLTCDRTAAILFRAEKGQQIKSFCVLVSFWESFSSRSRDAPIPLCITCSNSACISYPPGDTISWFCRSGNSGDYACCSFPGYDGCSGQCGSKGFGCTCYDYIQRRFVTTTFYCSRC